MKPPSETKPKPKNAPAARRTLQANGPVVTADLAHAVYLTCLKMSELAETLVILEEAVATALAAAETTNPLDGIPKPESILQ